MKLTNSKLVKKQADLHQWYHQNSKITGADQYRGLSEFSIVPPQKDYRFAEQLNLDFPEECSDISLLDSMLQRRSVRKFSGEPVGLSALSTLLYYSHGVKNRIGSLHSRSYASAGGRYSSEVYILVKNVEGMKPGVYHYDGVQHKLDVIHHNPVNDSFLINEQEMGNYSFLICIGSYFDGMTQKYGERGYRYCLFDVGQICQNVYLLSTALEIGCCAIGGFYDDELNRALGLDGHKESSILVMAVGRQG
ncbi:SagB/ThcOx family dehydrogenase [Falsibacillus albus]|uniref:SagB/ThcOx family dehydrogenase n=1 Tax=Falsibacillus albus TaxID=2478915 RepID=A0A3L7JXI8_9BACI|nr:SagB/ThcOx family dehydrogenase [Falsibacillus albus]RLQ94839.1 SagB/ThcOx family dehydrogenase [Falsibacillus albus]